MQAVVERLAVLPHVWGIARGFARTDGVLQPEAALLVFVPAKLPAHRLSPLHRVPPRLARTGAPDVRVDVVELDPPAATGSMIGPAAFVDPVRPLQPGYSFGSAERTGTLGLVVVPAEGEPAPLLLSSSHVMNPRADGTPHALYQPGGRDRRPGDPSIARSWRYVRLSRTQPNRMEAGLGVPETGLDCLAVHPLGRLTGVRPPQLGERLRKVGRTTGAVEGRVTAVDWCGRVAFGRCPLRFAGQALVEGDVPISLDGDSGSVWLSESGEAVAMNFAGCGRGRVSLSTPIDRVLRRLGAKLPAEGELANG